ncbi:MAG: hypothetical protein CMJ49_03970 [Planctomycetaceae bacterium]|nr:hypothetical protein [Planctomycetaceae bacterium]
MTIGGGCAPIGYVAQIFDGNKIPAMYELPDRATAVLIDDPTSALPDSSIQNLLGGRIGQELTEHEAIADLTAPRLIDELRHNHGDFNEWPIDKIGMRAGADQVVYVLIERFNLSDEQRTYRPVYSMRVKVVDAASGRRLFPAGDAGGYRVASELFFKQELSGGTDSTRRVVARRLAEHAAVDVAKLFYEHAEREPGSGFDD